MELFRMIDKFLREKKLRRRQLTVFLCLALVVALGTMAALKLTGIAKTKTLSVLKCPADIHTHTQVCYDGENSLICGYADFAVHTHSLDCYYEDRLICQLPVIEAHTHTEDCYAGEEYLVCGQADGEHVHTEACYAVRDTLVCGKEEILLHTHTVDCFKEAVFDESGVMVAFTEALPEGEAIPDTWTRDMVPACGQLQIEEHIHGAGCLADLTPEEADAYLGAMDGDEIGAWSGVKEGAYREDVGSDDGEKTVREQLTWAVTVHFPNDETWTDFTYTDSFRQTLTGWFLQEDGESSFEEAHPIHHYQLRGQLDTELNIALQIGLAQAGLSDQLTYTYIYKDAAGNEVSDDSAEAVGFEIRFHREAGENLGGRSVSFDYTTLVDTDGFADGTEYTVENDFTLPDFAGTGSFHFRYTDRVSNGSETEISVKKVWQDVMGEPLTDGLPDSVAVILKQYAFAGGVYLTEMPEDPAGWCELILHIDRDGAEDQHDVWIRSLTGEVLGANTAAVWIPRNSRVQLSAASGGTSDGGWSYTVNVKDVSSCELTIAVDDGYDAVVLTVTGKAPAGFVPSGDFTRCGDAVALSNDNDWSHSWGQLPLNDGNNTQYVYAVEETALPEGYYVTVTDDGAGAFTLTNRKSSTEPGKITVEKKWVDLEGNLLVAPPDSVEMELQKKVQDASAAEDEWVTVENSSLTLPNENGEWTGSWTGLEEGEYRVAEKTPEGFMPFYFYTSYDSEGNRSVNTEGLAENSGYVTVVNVEAQAEDGEIIVEKEWEYEDGTPDNSHPDSVSVTVKRARKSSDDESEPESSEPSSSEPSSSEPSSSEPSSSEPSSSEPSTPEDDGDGSYPTTGDTVNPLPYIMTALVSGILLLALALYSFKQRSRRKENTAAEEDIDE